jgi:hypothetical protein
MSAVMEEQPYVRPAWLDPWLQNRAATLSKRQKERAERKSANEARRAENLALKAAREAEQKRLVEHRRAVRCALEAERQRIRQLEKVDSEEAVKARKAHAAEREWMKQQRQASKELELAIKFAQPAKPVRPGRGRPRGSSSFSKVLSDEGFTPDPIIWPDDGGAKRVAIYDHNFGQKRFVRRVGWTNCLGREPRHRIFSYDVTRERMCSSCKGAQARGNIDD